MSFLFDIEWRQVVDPHLVVHADRTESSGLTQWSESIPNPVGGDLILVTIHTREPATVTGITYGGAALEQLASASADWPTAWLYAIKAEDQPTEGESHDLVVSFDTDTSGAVTFSKIRGIADSVLSNPLSGLTTAVVDNSDTSTSIDLAISETSPFLVFSALTHRDGCPANLISGDELLSAGCFATPRGYGVGLAVLPEAGTHTVSWEWDASNRRRLVAVAIPRHSGFLPDSGEVSGLTEIDYTQTDLDPETEYEWRARTDDDGVKSAWSDWIQFETLADSPGLTTPTNLTTTNITADSFRAGWTP